MNDIQHIKKSLIQQFKNIKNKKNCNKCKSYITQLEIIAVISMFIDHIYYLPFDYGEYGIYLKIIGRIALPIYVYLILQGVTFTKNLNDYRIRLFILALISEPAYQLFLDRTLNIIWFLIYASYVYESFIKKENQLSIFLFSLPLSYYEPVFFFGYSWCFIFYYFKSFEIRSALLLISAFTWGGIIHMFSLLGVLILHIKPRKYVFNRDFYRFSYPVHLLLYFIITELYS